MDIYAAVHQRRSIRAFRADPVPRETLKGIMQAAVRAPSWANTQPWEFVIATGEKVEEIGRAYAERAMGGEQGKPDLSPPAGFPEPFDSRRRSVGRGLFGVMEIARDDRETRAKWQLRGLRLFRAPVVIYILTDRAFYAQESRVNIWPVFDCGLVAENIMLLSTEHGLGTIPAIQAAMYPDLLRKTLNIPNSKMIVLGIGIGYPDMDDPANHYHSEREPLDSTVTWCGFH
jgi:nitroreductase